MEDPSSVKVAHQAFVDAGSQVITTNSYAVVPFHIGEDRFVERGAELIRLSGQLAQQVKQAAGETVLIAAGIPPVFGSYNPNEFVHDDAVAMLEVFKQNLLPYTDIILAETQSSIAEVTAIQSVFGDCGQPLWISMTLEDEPVTGEESRLRSGELLRDTLESINFQCVDAVLFNCSQPEVMAEAVKLAAKMLPSGKDIGVYANGFRPITNTIDANDGYSVLREDLTPQDYLAFAEHWQQLGATMVGGCCGIGPDHISLLKRLND
ncbi:MAG: Bifunctional homocysteine S-methyltransferase/5,10-methylenetetrahydrofolate reductase [Porticoccaceae bacterium UBA1117]|nr:MAG: Bifunctional homocysteine S-methyltransferase/5,10-methylenetetrahydrofolate reductase [Porticoccaceae bacterium UBA1117]